VKDLNLMRTFYETCFGLSVTESDGNEFCVLVSGDWDLSLVRMPPVIAATIVTTHPPQRRADTPVKLAFEVESIEQLKPIVTGTGGARDRLRVECVKLLGCRVARTGRVPDVRDAAVLAGPSDQAYLTETVAAHVLDVDLPARNQVIATGGDHALLNARNDHGGLPLT
jgi:hypothetical protein